MSEPVMLLLKINGEVIKGESTQTKLGKQDMIECIYFDHQVHVSTDSSGMATGKRQYNPIMIRKRIDKSTPLLFKAIVEGAIVEARFLFYRPNPTGDGTTEQFYTIEITKARIVVVRDYVHDTLLSTDPKLPPFEEISFVFQHITLTYNKGGITFEDSFNSRM